jgi:asparagine synthase (glutamine-hydrolysing)
MSILFGICQAEGHDVEERQLMELARATVRYAPDGTFLRTNGRIGMGFQPNFTHQRSNLEVQPAVDQRGDMVTMDGRIDNQAELCRLLELDGNRRADSQIVLAAFERWGEECFAKLIGDWSVALWSQKNQLLYLARDHAGTRTLYFRVAGDTVYWSTYLEPLVLDQSSLELSREYTGRYLAGRPIGDWTPFRGISAVTPSHYFVFHHGEVVRKPHWKWLITSTIRYGSDAEYEEHFLSLFQQSVQRRTGPGASILAQLSGGMDSTSIVCMSDMVRASYHPPGSQIDTISYYDDAEPHWDERPFFTLVEQARGKVGIHADASLIPQTFRVHDASSGDYLFPGADSSSIERERHFEGLDRDHRYRVILSGIGGDELLGGVPTPMPELAGYLMSGNLTRFFRVATAWSVANRTSLIQLATETVSFTGNLYLRRVGRPGKLPLWIAPELRQLCLRDGADLVPRGLSGLPPNSISNARTWWETLETLPHRFPPLLSRREWRYPYLDRDLVEFLFSVPRSQLVRPGRRRSLMRRALRDLVPTEILERRRKAFVVRSPIVALRANAPVIERLFSASVCAEWGLTEPNRLRELINDVVRGQGETRWAELMRAVAVELWLRSLASARTIYPGLQTQDRACSLVREQITSC